MPTRKKSPPAASSATGTPKKYKYKVLCGAHWNTDDGKIYNRGEEFESTQELLKHNDIRRPRYQLIDDIPITSNAQVQASADGLDEMSIEELINYAAEGEVDIADCGGEKAQIIAKIRAAG